MLARSFRPGLMILILSAGLLTLASLRGQDAAPADAPPPVPKGVEVLARGPVHEAFATLTAEPQPTKVMPKKPPQPLQEMPPDEKPDGDVVWIGGYWAWDDDRSDFLWVSGVWRTPPPGKQWVPGYWREQGDGWQWVPGFWTAVVARSGDRATTGQEAAQDVTYLPKPPDPPQLAAPGAPPTADTFYVPGHWEWKNGDYYWVAGFWSRVQPGYVWIPGHYRWTPGGYIYIAGYWDYTVKRRGVLYAPVIVDADVVGAAYVYTPVYAVDDTVVVDALFVRPCTCHYYFGDYYDVGYRDAGYTSVVVYSRTNYDSIVVYERYEHRDEPDWYGVQVNLYNDRAAGRAPVPPRTLNQQINVVNNVTNVTNVNNVNNVGNNVTVNKQVTNTTVLAPASKVMAAKGTKVVKLDSTTRQQVQQQSAAVQQASLQRTQTEVPAPGGPLKQPHVASLNVPPTKPVSPKAAVETPTKPITAQGQPAALPPGTAKTTTPPVTTTPAPTLAVTPKPTTPPATTTPAPTTPVVTPKPNPPATPATTPAPPTAPPATPAVTPAKPVQPPPKPVAPPPPPPAKRPPPPPPKDKDKDK